MTTAGRSDGAGHGDHPGQASHDDRAGSKDRGGHDHSAMVADFKRRFLVSMAITVPVLVFSPAVQSLVGFGDRLRTSTFC